MQGAPIDTLGIHGHFELDTIKYVALESLFIAGRRENIKVVISELDIDVVSTSRWRAEGGKYQDE
jgi:GH35 family endo-1,4-beta-xylanase